jgi:uncharacterized protein with NAD-binding domain and iron-sulfur cluster
MLPAPAHFLGSFLKLKFLTTADKIAIARAINAIPREHRTRTDLDRITMLDWLREKRQTEAAIERYWRQVSTMNIRSPARERSGFSIDPR